MKEIEKVFGLTKVSRRDFNRRLAGLGVASVVAKATPSLAGSEFASAGGGQQSSSAGQNASRECDILIKGGTVIDPSQKLHAVMDVAVKGGKILEVSRDFPEARARTVVSAKDKIVTPGFVDIFAQVFDGVTRNGVNADLTCLVKGVTTVVDTSTGWPTIAGFRKYVVNTSATRVYAILDVGMVGQVASYRVMQIPEWVNPELAAEAAEENKPVVVGINVQVGGMVDDGTQSLEFDNLKKGVQAAEACRLPLRMRYLNPASTLPPFLKMLRKGDILTHIYNRKVSILDVNGKILPEVKEARQRGVLFDLGRGLDHLVYAEADKCLQQDFLPDTLSTCQVLSHPYHSEEVSIDMPTLVSEFLLLGVPLDKAIELVTARPAKVYDYGLELGTLRPEREADVSIFELREGKFTFVDYTGDKRVGRQRLFPVATLRSGRLFETAQQFDPDPGQVRK